MPDNQNQTVQVVYDSECPACNAYCTRVRPASDKGVRAFQLVDARRSSAVMHEITRRGLDIDQGMVVTIDGQISYGADAIAALATVSSARGVLGRLNRWSFGAPWRARMFYPVLRNLRNLLLRAMGKTKINNLRVAGNERF